MNEQSSPADAAWAFLVDFYGRVGVSEACLVLQDEAGLDVVEMLMLVYADIALGKSLSNGEIAAMRAGMSSWRQDVVLPLRALRRTLKPAREDIADNAKEQLRAQIKKAELTAERLQVDFLARWLENATSGGPALAATLSGLIPEHSHSSTVEKALAQIIALAQAGRVAPTQRPAAP
ncbi:TIGR02444 family protein [Mesorhizobium sp. B2-7-1]|uniref:TIGR02444 family protein n=1 Tax=Mesorhizobium sp. B2-7-1 TaxID=2589909 RepID=UPI0015E2E751|nr:TIGR02444 family protein [Mesorhizobium sp. B2-7-1]